MGSVPQAEKSEIFVRMEEIDGKEAKKGEMFGRALNGFDRRTGKRTRCFTCNSEFHFAPNGPSRDNRGIGSTPSTPVWGKPSRPPFSSAMESSISLRDDGLPEKKIKKEIPSSLPHYLGSGWPVSLHGRKQRDRPRYRHRCQFASLQVVGESFLVSVETGITAEIDLFSERAF